MKNIDEKKNKLYPCEEITPFECLWICDFCNELFQSQLKDEKEKKAQVKKRESEVMINEIGDLGKWSGGD